MNYNPIEIDEKSGIYKTLILAHFFLVSISALTINFIVLGIIIKRIYKGASTDIKLSALVIVLDTGAAIGTFIRAVICQNPRNLLAYSPNWCKFDALFTTQLFIFSGFSIGILSVEKLLLVCFNKKLSIWIFIGAILVMCGSQYSVYAMNVFKGRQRIVNIAVYCTVGVVEGADFLRDILIFNLVSSYAMVIFSYLSIMIFRYKHSFEQLSMNLPKDQVFRECFNTFSKSLANIILFVIVYFGKVYSIIYEVASGNLRTWLMDYVSTILISCSLILNVSILLYMNTDIRKDLIKLITTFKLTVQ